jgi:ABC-2 type transport system ATP-binding protein
LTVERIILLRRLWVRGAKLTERKHYISNGRFIGNASWLSGGWKQRLAWAQPSSTSQALFWDEPTAGVDPISRRAFWN